MYVQLKDGYKLWAGPQFVTESVTEGEDAQEREEEGPELEDDLGPGVRHAWFGSLIYVLGATGRNPCVVQGFMC